MTNDSLNDLTGPVTGWECEDCYVWPLNDLRPHVWNDDNCWCKPFCHQGMVVHNSMDGREYFEPDSIHQKRKPS